MVEENRQNLVVIRNIARKVLDRNFCIVPVAVEDIASQFASIEEDDFPGVGDAIFVKKGLRSEKGKIILRNGMPEARRRFTIAHEIGHNFIPWHIGSLGTFMCNTNTYNDNEPFEYYTCEKEANQFAAELLMPFDWTSEILNRYTTITESMNAIVKAARVSYQSAAYRLPYVLGDGYEVLITDKLSDITRRYFSGYSRPIDLRIKGETASACRRRLVKAHDAFIGDTVDVHLYYYGNTPHELFPDRETVRDYSANQLLQLMNDICRSQNVSILHMVNELGKRMSDMMLLFVQNIKTKEYQFVHGQGSQIRLPNENDEEKCYKDYSKMASDQCRDIFGDFSFTFWCFANKHDMSTAKKLCMPSVQILEEILAEEYWINSDSVSIMRSINGIIGAANNERRKQKYDKNNFYNFLKQKFSLRNDLRHAVRNENFDSFLARKVEEIYSRDVGA